MTIHDCILDTVLVRGYPAGIFTPLGYDPAKPNLLVYASCHGRTLMEFLRNHAPVASAFNLLRLETGPMLASDQRGEDIFNHPGIHHLFAAASVIVTYNMGSRMGPLSLQNVSKWFSPSVKVITFTAPNFSALLPFAHGYSGTLGVYDALDRGQEPEAIWKEFLHGDFDPMFRTRWRIEMGRLTDRDTYHDIGLANFVSENHKLAKLWMWESHPSFVTMTYVGSEVARLLGLPHLSTESILAANPDTETMGKAPETDYEFKHYGFKYPKRFSDYEGGIHWYRHVFDNIVSCWRTGGLMRPIVD